MESQGTYQAPFIIRYFDQIIKEGRMPDVKEIIYLYPRLGEQELIMMSRTLSKEQGQPAPKGSVSAAKYLFK